MHELELWTHAVKLVDARLLSRTNRRAELLGWVQDLRKHGRDTERLVMCLAIDLVWDAYRPEVIQHIVALFESIDIKATDARAEFAHRLETYPKRTELNCASCFLAEDSAAASGYSVVMRFQRLESCFGDRPIFQQTTDDHDRLLRKLSRRRRIQLSNPDAHWTSERGVVWVALTSELTEILHSVPEAERATTAKNALGLAHPAYLPLNTPLELFWVQYPASFSIPCYQPTTFDAWWSAAGQYYLSWRKENAWGRTQSCTAIAGPVKERVHNCYKGPTGTFEVSYLGKYPGDNCFMDQIAEGREALRAEAYNRLAFALNSGRE